MDIYHIAGSFSDLAPVALRNKSQTSLTNLIIFTGSHRSPERDNKTRKEERQPVTDDH